MNDDKTIDPEHLSIDQPSEADYSTSAQSFIKADEDQDELWMDAAAIMEQSHLDDENYKETLSALKSKYTITRK